MMKPHEYRVPLYTQPCEFVVTADYLRLPTHFEHERYIYREVLHTANPCGHGQQQLGQPCAAEYALPGARYTV